MGVPTPGGGERVSLFGIRRSGTVGSTRRGVVIPGADPDTTPGIHRRSSGVGEHTELVELANEELSAGVDGADLAFAQQAVEL